MMNNEQATTTNRGAYYLPRIDWALLRGRSLTFWYKPSQCVNVERSLRGTVSGQMLDQVREYGTPAQDSSPHVMLGLQTDR